MKLSHTFTRKRNEQEHFLKIIALTQFDVLVVSKHQYDVGPRVHLLFELVKNAVLGIRLPRAFTAEEVILPEGPNRNGQKHKEKPGRDSRHIHVYARHEG
jgi:hypothetical protein